MAVESSVIEFFLKSKVSEILIQTISLSHSGFSQTYNLTPNSRNGVTVTLENDSSVAFEYCPMIIRRLNSSDNLDQSFSITVGDVGQIISAELSNVLTADSMSEKPVCTYRAYSSNDLTTIIYGPYELEVRNLVETPEGAQFEVQAPTVNATGTGRVYTFERFPSLKGFL